MSSVPTSLLLQRFDAAGRPQRAALPPSFPEHVRQLLELEIIEGRLAPGERVAEEDLARRMGVSRTPVREAMHVLEGRGLIVRRRGRGTFVARRTSPEEARALYEMRIPLEGYLAGRAAHAATDGTLRQLETIQADFRQTLPQAGDSIDLRSIIALDSDFHWTIYNSAGSDLSSIAASYWGRLLRELYDRVYRSEQPSRFAVQHDDVIAALRDHHPEAARAAMETHIRSGWEATRLSFERGTLEPEVVETI